MFTLKSRKDSFRLILPKEFIPEEINEKYTRVLMNSRSFYKRPIDFVNETIQKIDVLGFNNGTIVQQQSGRGTPLRDARRVAQNDMMHMASDYNYRSVDNPIQLIDKTLNIDFRHTLGYLNYFILLESFIYNYSRDTNYLTDLDYKFKIDLLNHNGAIYSSIVLFAPIMNGMDMLSFDNSIPVANSGTFRVIFKYSNFDYEFIDTDMVTSSIDLNEYLSNVGDSFPYHVIGDSTSQVKDKGRIPILVSDSPFSNSPGGAPINISQMPGINKNNIGSSQIIYDDEGGVLRDMLYFDSTNSDKKIQIGESSIIDSPGNSNGTSDDSINNPIDDNIMREMVGTSDSDPSEKGFFTEIAEGIIEEIEGPTLPENLRFQRYPYERDYPKDAAKMSSIEIEKYDDNSRSYIDDEGNPSEYSSSELDKWESDFVIKSKFKKS